MTPYAVLDDNGITHGVTVVGTLVTHGLWLTTNTACRKEVWVCLVSEVRPRAKIVKRTTEPIDCMTCLVVGTEVPPA